MTGNTLNANSSKKRIFIAGHRGMAGSALVRQLEKQDGNELILRGRNELNLIRQSDVESIWRPPGWAA